jgi:replicative DNA helicase
MSLAEVPNFDERRSSAPEFDRTPPQDLVAEQSVLGGMLLSKDAIGEVVEVIRHRDFYRPAHELIFEVIVDLYGKGEPADAVTVSAELTKRGEITRAGGAPYLHTLISAVPTAANASYYAKIVRERAIARRLVEAGTKIVQLGYVAEGDVDSLVDMAEQEVYQVTERRAGEDYVQLSSLIPSALDQIEKLQSGELAEGIKTGFKDLDA